MYPLVKTAIQYERLASSRNGNPAYRIFFDDGTWNDTKTDTMWAYAADGSEWYNRPCVFLFDLAGAIVGARPVTQEDV